MKPAYTNFAGLAEAWLADKVKPRLEPGTVERYEWALAALGKHFTGLNGGLAAACAEWSRTRRAEVSPRTFNAELSVLRSVLHYGTRHGKPKDNPAEDIEEQRVIKPVLPTPSRDQLTALLAKLRENKAHEAADTIEFLCATGCRRAEAEALTWGDVDFAAGTLTIGRDGNTKNGQARVVPMTEALVKLLTAWKARLPDYMTDPEDRLISGRDHRAAIRRAETECNLPHYRAWHTWRSYFITEALLAGVDAASIARFVGHQDGGSLVYRTYGRVHDAHLKAMAAKII